MASKDVASIDKSQGEIVIYQTDNGDTKIDVRFVDETVRLTQAQLCELYQTSKSNISEHIKHIFEERELEEQMPEKSVTKELWKKQTRNIKNLSCRILLL